MNKLNFTKQDTNVAKGIFLIMMAVHHLFFDRGTFAGFSVDFTPMNVDQAISLAQYFRVCIGGFSFLTYYGMTLKFMEFNKSDSKQQIILVLVKRYLSLISAFFFVYVLALLAALLQKQPLSMIYQKDEISWGGYALIDALGMADFFRTPTLNLTWWYMSFAVIILFLFPVFYLLYERLGVAAVIAMIFLPQLLLLDQTYLGMCAFGMILGIMCAKNNCFVKWRALRYGSYFWKGIKLLVCLIVFWIAYRLLCYVQCSNLYYGISAVLWTYIAFEFLAPVKILRMLFSFLGKHSLNVFLIHTFLYYYYARNFIYSFRYAGIIVLVLLLASVMLSVIIELLKKILRYGALTALLQEKTGRWLLEKCRNLE